MRHWMRQVTASTDEEVARIAPRLADPVLEGARRDTAASPEELDVLVRRLRHLHPVRQRSGVLAPALALAAALLITVPVASVVLTAPPPSSAELSAPVRLGVLALERGVTHRIGASIQVEGSGELLVEDLHARGADLALVDGYATFQVDPGGVDRDLRVAAADVLVRVTGTIFTVQRSADSVGVQVDRGSVQVSYRGQRYAVLAGERWERPSPVVSAAGRASVPGMAAQAQVDALRHATSSAIDAVEPVAADSPGRSAVTRDGPASSSSASSARDPASPAGSTSGEEPARRPAAGTTTGGDGVAALRPNPCLDAPFSVDCAASRRSTAGSPSPEQLFEAITRAMERAGHNAQVDRATVDACNRFLEEHGSSPLADDVRAYRVQAAFTGARPSQVLRWADAYLAAAQADHAMRTQVEQWRAIAVLRVGALDSAQTGHCAEALPLLRELTSLEQGRRLDEAMAWRGVCAASTGAGGEAVRALRQVREETLPEQLRERVRDTWSTLR